MPVTGFERFQNKTEMSALSNILYSFRKCNYENMVLLGNGQYINKNHTFYTQ